MTPMFNKQFDDLMILECGSPLGKPPWGITQSIFDSWAISKNVGPYNVLHIPRAVASDFAEQEYYLSIQCDKLPNRLNFVVFQANYNIEYGKAVQFLQRSLGVHVDGVVGPITINAANRSNVDMTIKAFLLFQNNFYKSIDAEFHNKYKAGWHNRVLETARLVDVKIL